MLSARPTLHDKTRKLALLACYFQTRAIAQRARAEARQAGSRKRRKRPPRPNAAGSHLAKSCNKVGSNLQDTPFSSDIVASIRTLAET